MNLVQVVFLAGAHCLSPIVQAPGLTEVAKVSCAVLIQFDPVTSDVAIVPASAATDPAVIAQLVRSGPELAAAKADRLPLAAAGDITGSITRAPRIVPASDAPDAPPIAKPPRKKAEPAAARKTRAVASVRTSTACGSRRAVWYVNKDGHRRYRCVRTG